MRQMMSFDLAVAKILSRRRVALGLSPRSVKCLCGIEPRDLMQYEAGIRPLSRRRLFRVCEALAIKPDELCAEAARSTVNFDVATETQRPDTSTPHGSSA